MSGIHPQEEARVTCLLCPRHCELAEGETGFCRARSCSGGRVVSVSYGKLTALALDPIEKKPLAHFYPGSKILSVGSFGCNLSCPFCQNHEISVQEVRAASVIEVSPKALERQAEELLPQGNIGLAFTYNEPLIGFEFVADTARLAQTRGLKNVLVTNGMICRRPLEELLPSIDAMNIDLKGFSREIYRNLGGPETALDTVKESIILTAGRCHVEVTTLIVPGLNDSEEEMTTLSQWLASVDPEIPLHVTRFFPRWQMSYCQATPIRDVYRLAETARRALRYVYVGNC